jgi:hypothetical protein
MGISLVKAQLLSLGLTTFLYGASAPKSLHCSHLAFALADIHMDRIVLHALPRHNCGDVFQGVGGHPEAAQDDPPSFVLDVHGGNPSANTILHWQKCTFF